MADSAQKAPVSVDQSETSNKLDVGGLVPLVTAAAEGEAAPPLSKKKQKKQAKRVWNAQKKAEKKIAKKESAKVQSAKRKAQIDEALDNMTPEEREAHRQKAFAKFQERGQRKAEQKQKLRDAMSAGQHILIDLDFDGEMTEDQVKSLVQQLAYCYNTNSNAACPAHLEFSSFGGVTGSMLRSKLSGWERWLVTMNSKPYMETYAHRKEHLVYLSADSEVVLDELDPIKTYIIGGLVDRNTRKGLCEKRAKEQGIATASLPISQHAHLAGTHVLTVNQDCKSWPQVIAEVLPRRKVKKSEEDDEADGCADEEEAEGEIDREPATNEAAES